MKKYKESLKEEGEEKSAPIKIKKKKEKKESAVDKFWRKISDS